MGSCSFYEFLCRASRWDAVHDAPEDCTKILMYKYFENVLFLDLPPEKKIFFQLFFFIFLSILLPLKNLFQEVTL